ncbi:protein ELC-like [Nymphaea colorata]|uniref:UEV domain-containing protein n=1 Tax=Nymphaea colorata TaxID=210225 RepID=A0A5K1CW61_9MAGN|nr:protein ELC-like [Nymphaea colorata]XP_049933609.1 protein ELC-like [Nymphaea colorata]XP_049933610.1 protein ELC-like [Nymphaea colorata]XP_049933611.1 protein ELC-like [Nymphaea colorata]XP_049933612.1 protein ELC-like [Nymphaea colorata]
MYGSNSSHLTVQFLNGVLSQRGPSSLPYSEDLKWYIRQHLVNLVQEYPSLQVKTAVFAHNDGRTANLLQTEGTIPIAYQRVTYNIPVVIWLLESYPRQPPCVFVNPTRDMIIRRAHPLVNPSGVVSVPYLHHWVFPSSNLIELSKNMSDLFSRDPPLYTKQPSAASGHRVHSPTRGSSSSAAAGPSPSPPPPAPSASSSSSSSSSVWSHQAGGGRPGAGGVLNRLMSPYGRMMPPSPGSPQRPPPATEDPSEVFKRNATNKLLEMLHSDTVALRKAREAEMDSLFNLQGALRKREGQLDKGLKEMVDEKEALEQLLQVVLMNSDILEGWVKENGNKKKSDIDIDDVFEPADPLSRQILDCASADFSIEDTIYALDKAFQQGVIPFDAYMRNIRALSREQFFQRAMSAKVKAARLQAQVASMASRASPYGV